MTRPGVYSLNIGNRTYPVAVNVPPNEADVRVISADAIKKAMGDVDLAMEGDTLSAAALKIDSGNDWSWSFMALVLLLAGLECFLAMLFGLFGGQRRPTVAAEPQLTPGN
jgi:hypothetical protein